MKNTTIIILATAVLLIVFLLGTELSGSLNEIVETWSNNFDRLAGFNL